jgi:molybdate transport system permease protein
MAVLGSLFLVAILFPLLQACFWTTIEAFLREIADPEVLDAVRVSLITSTIASFLGLAFGVPLAYTLARKRFPGKFIVDTLVDLPMVLPPTVAGLALILSFGPQTPIGSWLEARGLDLIFTWRGIIAAQFFVSSPLLVRAARAAIESVDPNIEKAARTLGASGLYVFRTITFPLAARGIAAGWILMWARAVGEFGATLMVSSNVPGRFPTMPGTFTLPTTIYLRFLKEWPPHEAISVAIILLLMATAFSLLSKRIFVPKG